MDLGGRPRGRKSARLFRADRMELCLSFHFFHKIEHILIAVVRAVPLAVFADETGTDQYLKHNSPSFNARRTEFQAPASTHSAAQMAEIHHTGFLFFSIRLYDKSRTVPHFFMRKRSCFLLYFHRSRCVFVIHSHAFPRR